MLRETYRDETEGVEPFEKLAAYALEAAARREFGIGDVAREDSDYFVDTALDCWVENGGLDYAKTNYIIAIRTGIGILDYSGLSKLLDSEG
jgi:hypothetical protein